MYRFIIIFLSVLAGSACKLFAAAPEDSSFVTVRMLITSPGKEVYQSPGHAALHMSCPTHGLDYVFSFETDMQGGILGQFIGEAHGKMIAVTADEYLEQFRKEGRGVTAYTLNLTPQQKQELWRTLDEMLVTGEGRFNIRRKDCMSQVLTAINRACAPLGVGASTDYHYKEANAAYLERYVGERSPWSTIIIENALGIDCDVTDGFITRHGPLAFAYDYADIVLEGNGTSFPLVSDVEVLFEPVDADVPQPVTPVGAALLFAIIPLSAAVLRALRRARTLRIVLEWVSILPLTIAGLFLVFITYMPNHIGGAWNWNFVVLCPLWPVLWYFAGKNRATGLAWSAVLLLFAIFSPLLTCAMETPFVIIAAAMIPMTVLKSIEKL